VVRAPSQCGRQDQGSSDFYRWGRQFTGFDRNEQNCQPQLIERRYLMSFFVEITSIPLEVNFLFDILKTMTGIAKQSLAAKLSR
jgi:hypothetical protein